MANFQISDYYQLLTLHKAVLEAKFHQDPDRPELAGSPILAEIANRIVDILAEMEQEPTLPSTSSGWAEWRQMNNARPEWQMASLHARQSAMWAQWSFAEKEAFALSLFSPFIVDAAQLREFIDEVDKSQHKSEG